jgi:hypothetical protein
MIESKLYNVFNDIATGQLLLFTIIIELHFTNPSLAITEESLVKEILKKIFGYKEKEEPGERRILCDVNLLNCSVFLLITRMMWGNIGLVNILVAARSRA